MRYTLLKIHQQRSTCMSNIEDIIQKAVENWEIEIRRGVVVLLVLAALVEEDLHGIALINKISDKSSQVISIPLGTVYPLLRRFNNEGMIETYAHTSDRRKTMYRLNAYGKKFFVRVRELWLRYSSATNEFIDCIDEIFLG